MTRDRSDEDARSLSEILRAAMPFRDGAASSDGSTTEAPAADHREPNVVSVVYDRNPEWLVHQTELLRRPVFRTERSDSGTEPTNHYVLDGSGDGQSILAYPYDDQTELRSTLGELNARDMLVMSSIQQVFSAGDCPQDGLLAGERATLYHARQIGLTGGEATNSSRHRLIDSASPVSGFASQMWSEPGTAGIR